MNISIKAIKLKDNWDYTEKITPKNLILSIIDYKKNNNK